MLELILATTFSRQKFYPIVNSGQEHKLPFEEYLNRLQTRQSTFSCNILEIDLDEVVFRDAGLS